MKHRFFGLFVATIFGISPSLFAKEMRVVRATPVSRDHGTIRLTLEDAVDLAMRQNPAILNAKQEIERLHGLVIQVRAQALPQIALTSNYSQQSRELLAGTSGVSAAQADALQVNSWTVALQATQLLYSGGSVASGLRAAQFTKDSSYYALRQTIDDTIETVRTQFYAVLLNRLLITVQQESVDLLSSQLKDQTDRFNAGTVPHFNVLQAEVALANAQPGLINARNNYLISQLQLAKTLGINTDSVRAGRSPIEVIGNLNVEDRHFDLANGIGHAHAERPSLKVQRLTILSQVENVNVAISGYKPTLSVDGGYEVANDHGTQSLTRTVNGWFVGVQGNWNIFDGFATGGKVKQAKAELQEAKITYDDAVRQVDLEVEQAYTQLEVARETLASQTKNVQQADEALRESRERLNAGAGTQLDVLNSQVALTQARTTQAQAEYSFNVAVAQYEHATASSTQYKQPFQDPLAPHSKKHGKSKRDS